MCSSWVKMILVAASGALGTRTDCYSRSRLPGSATYPVRLTNPVSRFMQVRSLQYLCRFVIRQYTRIDLIQKLPLPNKMKDYLQEKHY